MGKQAQKEAELCVPLSPAVGWGQLSLGSPGLGGSVWGQGSVLRVPWVGSPALCGEGGGSVRHKGSEATAGGVPTGASP